jgi:hypothetical protein
VQLRRRPARRLGRVRGIRHPGRRLLLFFTAQALAVAAMIVVALTSRGQEVGRSVVLLSNAAILVELVMIGAGVSVDRPIWFPMLSLAAGLLLLGTIRVVYPAAYDPDEYAVLARWHIAVGLLLLGAVALSGALALLARRRRPAGGDETPAGDG